MPNTYSQESYESFIAWLKETYPGIKLDDDLIKQMVINENSEQYQYWIKFFWKPTHGYTYDANQQDYVWGAGGSEPNKPSPDGSVKSDAVVTGYSAPASTETTSTFKSALPSQLKVGGDTYNVNYTPIASFEEKDSFTGERTGRVINLYAPVTDLENLNDVTSEEIYKNIYAVYDTGEMWRDKPLSQQDLNSFIPYDVVNQKADLTELKQGLARVAMRKWANENGFPTLTEEQEKYISNKASMWGSGQYSATDVMQKELAKITGTESNEGATPEDIENYRQGETDYLQRVMSNAPKREDFNTEKQLLEATVKYYQDINNKYKSKAEDVSKTKTLPRNTADQYGIAGVETYNQAQQKLQDIASGKMTNRIYTQGAVDENLLRNTADLIGPMYQEDPTKLIPLAHDYIENGKMNPGWTMEERQALTNVALNTDWANNQGGTVLKTPEEIRAEKDKEFQDLINKARLIKATPQKKVSI